MENPINGILRMEETVMKKYRWIFGTLAFLSFFYILGVVGAMEQNAMILSAGAIRASIGFLCFVVFCKLAGAFTPPNYEKRKSR